MLGLSLSREGLWSMWNIVAKATIGACTSILLAATTEVPQIVAGLNRLRAPRVLTAIAGFMIRYLELIAEELRRMRVAMTARGYDPRWLWQVRPMAAAAGATFVRSYERASGFMLQCCPGVTLVQCPISTVVEQLPMSGSPVLRSSSAPPSS